MLRQPHGISTGPWDDQPCVHGNIDCEQCKEEAMDEARYVVRWTHSLGMALRPINDDRSFAWFLINPHHVEGDVKAGSIVSLDETPDGIDVYVEEPK